MKINRINFKKMSTILLSGVILVSSGCAAKKDNLYEDDSSKKGSSNIESSDIYEVSDKQSSILEPDTIQCGVLVNNIDEKTNKELPGTTLSISNIEGKELERWVTTSEPHYIELELGQYQLEVIKETDGYRAKKNNIIFNTQEGVITKISFKSQFVKTKISKEESIEESTERSQNSSKSLTEKTNAEESNESSLEESTERSQNSSKSLTEKTNAEESNESSLEESVIEMTNEEEYEETDVIDYLESIDNKINEKVNIAKDEIVEDYHIVYDFIFNGSTIKGYTFDELKTKTKAKIISIYLNIDEKIDSKFPGYKETIKEKYGDTKNKVKDKLSEFKEDIIDYIGEDKYNAYTDTKDKYVEGFKEQTKEDVSELKEIGGLLKDKAKEFIKKKN